MKAIITTIIFVLVSQISLFANNPQTPKLSNPHKTKKANSSYEMSKELSKTKKENKSSTPETKTNNSLNAKKPVNMVSVSA
jgi:hypothetical protein